MTTEPVCPPDFPPMLDKVILQTQIEHFRYLCLEYPDLRIRGQYQQLVREMGGYQPSSLLKKPTDLPAQRGGLHMDALVGVERLIDDCGPCQDNGPQPVRGNAPAAPRKVRH